MNCAYFKLEVNGILLPHIYFNYDVAAKELEKICKNNVATGGRIIPY